MKGAYTINDRETPNVILLKVIDRFGRNESISRLAKELHNVCVRSHANHYYRDYSDDESNDSTDSDECQPVNPRDTLQDTSDKRLEIRICTLHRRVQAMGLNGKFHGYAPRQIVEWANDMIMCMYKLIHAHYRETD